MKENDKKEKKIIDISLSNPSSQHSQLECRDN